MVKKKKGKIWVKGYTRSNGTRVKGHYTKDTGTKGRYKGKKWFKPKTKTGWKKTLRASTRRSRVLSSTNKRKSMHDRYVEAGRMMQALANVTTDEATERKAQADANYFFRKARK